MARMVAGDLAVSARVPTPVAVEFAIASPIVTAKRVEAMAAGVLVGAVAKGRFAPQLGFAIVYPNV